MVEIGSSLLVIYTQNFKDTWGLHLGEEWTNNGHGRQALQWPPGGVPPVSHWRMWFIWLNNFMDWQGTQICQVKELVGSNWSSWWRNWSGDPFLLGWGTHLVAAGHSWGSVRLQMARQRMDFRSDSTRSVAFPNLPFFLQILMVILDFLYLYMNFKDQLLNFCKEASLDFERDCIKPEEQCGAYYHLNRAEFTDPWTWDDFPFIQVFNFFQQFSGYKSCISFVKCIKFILSILLFWCYWKWNHFLHCYFWNFNFLVYRNTTDFVYWPFI